MRADFVDPTSVPPGSNWTEERAIAFNNYAKDLLSYDGNEATKYNEMQLQLDESFRQAGITGAQPLSVYTIKLVSGGECFGDDGHNLWWSVHRDQVKAQIEQTAYFVRDFHYATFGQTQGLHGFREVLICPEEMIGTRMRLEGYRLYIGMPSGLRSYNVIPARSNDDNNLRSLWLSGLPIEVDRASQSSWLFGIDQVEPFRSVRLLTDRETQIKEAVRMFWSFFNPLSPRRMELRKLMHERGDAIMSTVRDILGAGDRNANGLLPAVMARLLGGSSGDSDVDLPLVQAQLTALRTMGDADVRRVLDSWVCYLQDGGNGAAMDDAVSAALSDTIGSGDYNVRNAAVGGLVAVANHHRIHVGVSLGSGRQSRFVNLRRDRPRTDINVTANGGLVGVATSDDIIVALGINLDAGRSLQTAGFAAAVDAVRGGTSLCR